MVSRVQERGISFDPLPVLSLLVPRTPIRGKTFWTKTEKEFHSQPSVYPRSRRCHPAWIAARCAISTILS